MKTNLKMLLLLSLFSMPSLYGQAPDPAPIKAEMKKFSGWVGQWSGESTSRVGGGEAKTGTVIEQVQFKLDDTILVVEGVGKAKDANGKETMVHHAFGVLSYDLSTRQFKLKTYLANGRSTDAWFTVTSENAYQWGFDTPQGKIRYTIKIDPINKTWVESGEYSADGNTWRNFFDMNLHRVE